MAIQGETTPRPSSIFNFYFQIASSSVCVNTTAKSYCCYGDLKGKLFDIDDHQRVATIVVPSLLQLKKNPPRKVLLVGQTPTKLKNANTQEERFLGTLDLESL